MGTYFIWRIVMAAVAVLMAWTVINLGHIFTKIVERSGHRR